MKSEPLAYSIVDLKYERRAVWDGVRNYQARNFLRKMNIGDLAFFYHSNTAIPSITGMMRIVEIGIDDPTQFDPNSKYYDPKSTPSSPRWQTVRVEFMAEFSPHLTLKQLRLEFSPDDFLLLRQGNRLSVMPVDEVIAKKIIALSGC